MPGEVPLVTAICYFRVSSTPQAEDGYSLQTQLAECQAYAVRFGWVLGAIFTDIMTGARDDRPQYLELLEHVRRLRAESVRVVVVVVALDRFGRHLLERVRSREELKALGVATHSVREGGEVSDLVANILGAVAQEESRRIGERTHGAREYLRNLGWHTPGHAAWGYLWRPATEVELALGSPKNVLDADPESSPYVRELFRMVGDRMSARGASRWAAALPAGARSSHTLNHRSVLRVLHNETYLARPPARWPALVDEDTWARVQDFMTSHQQQAHQATGRYLLTGFMRCPKCGGAIYGCWISTAKGRYYRCSIDQAGGVRGCANWYAHADSLDRATLEALAELQAPFLAGGPQWQAVIRQAWLEVERPGELAGYRAARVGKFRRDAEQARARLLEAARLLVDGILDRGGYELFRDNAQAELAAAETEIARLGGGSRPGRRPDIDGLLAVIDSWPRDLQSVSIDIQRRMLAVLATRVVPTRLGKARYRVDLTLTPLGDELHGLRVALEALAAPNVKGMPR